MHKQSFLPMLKYVAFSCLRLHRRTIRTIYRIYLGNLQQGRHGIGEGTQLLSWDRSIGTPLCSQERRRYSDVFTGSEKVFSCFIGIGECTPLNSRDQEKGLLCVHGIGVGTQLFSRDRRRYTAAFTGSQKLLLCFHGIGVSSVFTRSEQTILWICSRA